MHELTNIAANTDYVDPAASEIADPVLQRLYDYWARQRDKKRMPSRADVDPVEMRFALGHVMLIEVLRAPLRFRVRLQGTELAWWLGSDLTGKMLDGPHAAALRLVLGEGLANCVITRAPDFRSGRQIINGLPRHHSTLVLPLSGDDRSVDMLLAGLRCFESAEKI